MRNMCIDRIRSRQRSGPRADMASAERHLQSAEHDDVERTETGRIIRNLIESLPPREREVIHLRDIEGMEITEIAEVTGFHRTERAHGPLARPLPGKGGRY